MIEIRHLRYFVVLAEERNFSRAAKRLFIAQPGLSRQIQSMEAQLGFALIDRTRRRFELTEAGAALLEEGRRALAEFDRALQYTRRVARGEVGMLRIGVIPSALYKVLPMALREYRRCYPEVEVIVREMTTPAQVNAMTAGEIDVGFMRLPYAVGELIARPIVEVRFGVVLPMEHPLTSLAEIPLPALAEEPLLFPAPPRSSWADFVLKVCRDAGFEPRIGPAAAESTTVMSFVAAGMGVALIPESLQGLALPGSTYRHIAPPAPPVHLAFMHKPEPLTPTAQGLTAIVDELWPKGVVADPPPERE